MTISSISSSDYYSTLANTNTQSTHRGRGGLSKALDSIESALTSGDTSTAQSILSDMLSRAPQSSSSTGNSSPADKITNALKQVQSALASGDTSSAQSALASLQDSLPSNRGAMGVGGTSAGQTQSQDPLSDTLDSIESALSSGDTSTAQSLLSALLAHAPKSSATETDSGSTSTDSSSGSNPAQKITSFLKELKSALASGDTSSAETVVSSLKDCLSSNPMRPPSGTSMYSTDGGIASDYSGASSSVNFLA